MGSKLALGILALAVITAEAGVLRDEVNKFNGTRSIEWRSIPEAENAFAFSAAVGIPEHAETRYFMGQLITYGRMRFDDCNRSYWLLDGKRAPEIETKYKVDHGSTTTLESFALTDPEPMLKAIAKAGRVEFQICGVEGEVAPSDLEGIRQVLQQAND